MHRLSFFLVLVLLLCHQSCKSPEKLSKTKDNPKKEDVVSGVDLDKLCKLWDVESIDAAGKLISGAAMGDPRYEFTKDGQRIKSYEIPPHSESVDYEIRNDSIHYKGEKDLPSVHIKELTDSTLILSHEKAEWKLYIK